MQLSQKKKKSQCFTAFFKSRLTFLHITKNKHDTHS